MLDSLYRGTNRDMASQAQIFALCELLWNDEMLHSALLRVGVKGYFDMDEYLHVHKMITEYWQATGGDIYLGDLFLAEAIVRKVTTDEFSCIECKESIDFIKKHRPHRHDDGSLVHNVPASVDEILELIIDLQSMVGVREFCDQAETAYDMGDREKIERVQSKENYLAERYRRKKGYMDKLGYNEAFTVLRDFTLIETLTERYSRRGKTVHLRHLSPDCKALLHKAGSMVEQIEGEDPDYGIAVDYNEYSEDH